MIVTDRLRLTYHAGSHLWTIHDRAAGVAIGMISCHGQDGDATVIGYEIANSQRDRGFATEALRAVLQHTATPLIAETGLDHVASRRVMEKAGMHLDGIDGGRARYRYDGAAVPSTP